VKVSIKGYHINKMVSHKRVDKGWGGIRAGAGRPKLQAGQRQDAGLLLRLRPAELKALKKLAREQGLTVGVYAREVLRRDLKRQVPKKVLLKKRR